MAEESERTDQEQVEEEEPEVDAAADRAAKPEVGRAKSRGIPKGSAVPKDPSRKSKLLTRFGKVGEPISPAETAHALYATHVAIGGILNSTAFDDVTPTRRGGQLGERDFQFYGAALSDTINHMLPEARIALRLVAPLTCVGEEIRIMRRILEEVPEDAWWRRARARAQRQEQEAAWQPYVVPDLEQAS